MDLEAKDLYNLYWGGTHVTGNRKYLWPTLNQEEAGEQRERRRVRTAYPNFQKKIVNTYRNYSMFGKFHVEDSRFISMRQLASDIIVNVSVGGLCWVLVLKEGPKVYERFRVNFDKENNSITIDGNEEGEKIEITLFKSGRQNGVSGVVKSIAPMRETIIEPFFEEMLFPCFWDSSRQSLIQDTAAINVQIFNYESVIDQLIGMAAQFNTSGPKIGKDFIPPFWHIPDDPNGSKFDYHSPDVTPIEKIRQEANDRIMKMAAIVGLTREFSEELKLPPSGYSQAFQLLETNSTSSQIAKAGQSCANRAANVHRMLVGGKAGSIQLSPNLSPKADADKLALLNDLQDSIVDDDILKAVQKIKLRMALDELPDGQLAELVKKIDEGGGLAMLPSPGVRLGKILQS